MAAVGTYLNFDGRCEEAFAHYRKVFGGDYDGDGIMRFGDMPAQPDQPPMPETARQRVMHVSLPILGGHALMGSDTMPGQPLVHGNSVHVSLNPDSKAEADRLFHGLVEGGTVDMPMADQFWGDYFGMLTDRFGIHWMINCASKQG